MIVIGVDRVDNIECLIIMFLIDKLHMHLIGFDLTKSGVVILARVYLLISILKAIFFFLSTSKMYLTK